MTLSQVESGRAFEYGIASAFNELYGSVALRNDANTQRAKAAFQSSESGEQHKILMAANKIATFLIEHDKNLRQRAGCKIHLQSDLKGIGGDVRDVVIRHGETEIGLSAKNRHSAVKHSRLSQTIDFGEKWFGFPCRAQYFSQIASLFKELRSLRDEGILWRDLNNKAERFYVPLLAAFEAEARWLCSNPDRPKRMVEYMMGKYDFYKIIKQNGTVLIQSFNLHGALGWGKRLKFPTRLIEATMVQGSDNKMTFTFDQGWQLSFRIHNASTRVEPSLKFDVQIVGLPAGSQHEIQYH